MSRPASSGSSHWKPRPRHCGASRGEGHGAPHWPRSTTDGGSRTGFRPRNRPAASHGAQLPAQATSLEPAASKAGASSFIALTEAAQGAAGFNWKALTQQLEPGVAVDVVGRGEQGAARAANLPQILSRGRGLDLKRLRQPEKAAGCPCLQRPTNAARGRRGVSALATSSTKSSSVQACRQVTSKRRQILGGRVSKGEQGAGSKAAKELVDSGQPSALAASGEKRLVSKADAAGAAGSARPSNAEGWPWRPLSATNTARSVPWTIQANQIPQLQGQGATQAFRDSQRGAGPGCEARFTGVW